MIRDLNRRDLFKLGVAGAAVMATGNAIGLQSVPKHSPGQ